MVRDGCESILVLFREYSATVCAAGLKYGKAWRAHCTIIAVEVKFIGFSDVRRAGEMGFEGRISKSEDRSSKFDGRTSKTAERNSEIELRRSKN